LNIDTLATLWIDATNSCQIFTTPSNQWRTIGISHVRLLITYVELWLLLSKVTQH